MYNHAPRSPAPGLVLHTVIMLIVQNIVDAFSNYVFTVYPAYKIKKKHEVLKVLTIFSFTHKWDCVVNCTLANV